MILKSSPIKLECVSAVISENIVPVLEYCEGIASPKKLKRIIAGTGFESLSIADVDVCTSDMCFQAAEQVFENHRGGGIYRDSIGALIFISQTADYPLPATAYILQDRLNLPKNLIAFDVSIGCSGFVYGLYLASLILNTLNDKKVMICCGDVNTRGKKPKETGSGALFGDAGACAVVSKSENTVPILFNIHSYGERWDKLVKMNEGARYNKKIAMEPELKKLEVEEKTAYMDGMAITDFTINEVPANIEELLRAANLSKDDIGAYLFHQPQKLLIDSLTDRLGVNPESVIFNSQNIGNTSSASIPLLLTEIGKNWNNHKNKKVLMSGFGVGLSVASVILDLDSTICLETRKYERNKI